MAEFHEVAHQYKRMCRSYVRKGCINCPMNYILPDQYEICDSFALWNDDKSEHVIMKWAERNPEEE